MLYYKYMSAVIAEMIDTPVYDENAGGGIFLRGNSISAGEAYSYRADTWRDLSNEDFYSAIVTRAKDARNRPRKPWRTAIDEVFNNPKRRYANA